MISLKKETVIHSLFGGEETKPKEHKVVSIEVCDLKESNKCSFEALSEKMICGFVPKINNSRIFEDLKKRKICLSDSFCKKTEIDLLLRVDILGKLLTENVVILDSGLTGVETKLGWTVMGKDTGSVVGNQAVNISLHVNNVSLKSLWELEALGISDPLDDYKRRNENAEKEIDFQNKLSILPHGRHKLELPWKYEFNNLSDNKRLALTRHQKMIKRAKENSYLKDYQKVLQEWENLNII